MDVLSMQQQGGFGAWTLQHVEAVVVEVSPEQ